MEPVDYRSKLNKLISSLPDDKLAKVFEAASKAAESDLSRPAIPTAPPKGELYKPRGPESAPNFIERVYGEWLTGYFTRADLRRLDEKAEMALRNWEREHGRAPINLPTVKEKTDRILSEQVPEISLEAQKAIIAQRSRAFRAQK